MFSPLATSITGHEHHAFDGNASYLDRCAKAGTDYDCANCCKRRLGAGRLLLSLRLESVKYGI